MSNNSREASSRLSDEEFTKMMNGFNANYIDVRELEEMNRVPELFYTSIEDQTENKLVWATKDMIERQLKISTLQKQIVELEERKETLSKEIDIIRLDNNIYVHDMSRLNELYSKSIEILDKLFNLERELYYLQQNNEDIIPD